MAFEEINQMTVLTLDVETTTFQKGNPFSQRNLLVCVGLKKDNEPSRVYYDPTGLNSDMIRHELANADLIVGFNLKFDLSWLEREKLYDPYTNRNRFWDCQLVDFLLERQAQPYPSLDSTCAKYALGSKLDVVASEYWDKGIDTDAIPKEILAQYLKRDLDLTYSLYKAQEGALDPSMDSLARLVCQDLPVLQQMESNGLVLDTPAAMKFHEQTINTVSDIEKELKQLLQIEVDINWNSTFHRSVALYGGEIEFEKQVQVGFYKTGLRKNQPKMQTIVYKVGLSRVFDPIPGSELNKEGYWSTDDATLGQLEVTKDTKRVLELLKMRAEHSKLATTYLAKWPEMITTMDWKPDQIHGSFHQCVAITGRLSSSRPNLQNPPDAMKQFIRSRYA
jgi:DNA polymerase I-like protein with 3'-5' exonuclease and polymerase domains